MRTNNSASLVGLLSHESSRKLAFCLVLRKAGMSTSA